MAGAGVEVAKLLVLSKQDKTRVRRLTVTAIASKLGTADDDEATKIRFADNAALQHLSRKWRDNPYACWGIAI